MSKKARVAKNSEGQKPGNRSIFMRLLEQRLESMVTELRLNGDYTTSCVLAINGEYRATLVVNKIDLLDL